MTTKKIDVTVVKPTQAAVDQAKMRLNRKKVLKTLQKDFVINQGSTG